MSSRTFTLLVVMTLAVWMAPADVCGESWSIGSHLGLASIRSGSPYVGSTTVLAWPANAFTYQPGLRLALGNSMRTHEVLLDSGLFYLDQAGSFLSLTVVALGYQRTLFTRRASAPFVNASVGLVREGGAARTSTSMALGAGAGVRRVIGNRHGSIRAEVRVDRVDSDDVFARPTLTMLGLRLGFDMWL